MSVDKCRGVGLAFYRFVCLIFWIVLDIDMKTKTELDPDLRGL